MFSLVRAVVSDRLRSEFKLRSRAFSVRDLWAPRPEKRANCESRLNTTEDTADHVCTQLKVMKYCAICCWNTAL